MSLPVGLCHLHTYHTYVYEYTVCNESEKLGFEQSSLHDQVNCERCRGTQETPWREDDPRLFKVQLCHPVPSWVEEKTFELCE